jgi:hypothetical protein
LEEAFKLLFDKHRTVKLTENITKLARPQATTAIVNEIEKLLAEKSVDHDLPAKDKTIFKLDKKTFDQHLDASGLQPAWVRR